MPAKWHLRLRFPSSQRCGGWGWGWGGVNAPAHVPFSFSFPNIAELVCPFIYNGNKSVNQLIKLIFVYFGNALESHIN